MTGLDGPHCDRIECSAQQNGAIHRCIDVAGHFNTCVLEQTEFIERNVKIVSIQTQPQTEYLERKPREQVTACTFRK